MIDAWQWLPNNQEDIFSSISRGPSTWLINVIIFQAHHSLQEVVFIILYFVVDKEEDVWIQEEGFQQEYK